MRIGIAIVICLFVLEACRGAPRAPTPRDTPEQQDAAPKDDPCAQYQYGICPTDTKPDKTSGGVNGASPDEDLPVTVASFVSQNTEAITVKVIVDRQQIDGSEVTLSDLDLTINPRSTTSMADNIPYTLSLKVSANTNQNNTDYCASGRLTGDNLAGKSATLTVSEGVCQ